VTDYEWEDSKDIIKSIIKSRLGCNDLILGARNCILAKIDIKVANDFFKTNHLQGPCNAKVAYALYHDNELVSCMSFGTPRFNKAYDYELLRFANKLNTTVSGSFQKLLKAFRSEQNGSIISYANRRLFSGQIYVKSGFNLEYITKPGYVWSNGNDVLSRYKTQKKKLLDIQPLLNKELSETNIMEMNGYEKLWDADQYVFSLK
jgi:hypothetical protein